MVVRDHHWLKSLGHSTVSMTLDIYGHLMPGWQREAAELFAVTGWYATGRGRVHPLAILACG